VYGDKKGKWVNENTNPRPSSTRGRARLKAENEWLQLYKKYKLPIQIFRLSGIYSTENNIIKRLRMGTHKIVKKNNHFFSRIHVEDIAEILCLSLSKINPGNIFNISDDYPCSNYEITKYASDLINTEIPKTIVTKDIKDTMIKEFYKDSKKVDNKKMKEFFNYNLKYPTFKDGLRFIVNQIP
jgi:nucleoside-diphosphate-sugar epimerase